MNLINGTRDNGMFAGTIPAIHKGNITVNYYVTAEDENGYSKDGSIDPKEFSTESQDISGPSFRWGPFYFLTPSQSVSVIEAWVVDSGNGVKDVNFTDGKTLKPLKMSPIDGDKWDGVYRITVSATPNLKNIGTVSVYYLSAKNKTVHISKEVKPRALSYMTLVNTDPDIHGSINVNIDSKPDIHNLTAKSQFIINGNYPIRDIIDITNTSVKVENIASDTHNRKDYFDIAIKIEPLSAIRHLSKGTANIQHRVVGFYFNNMANYHNSGNTTKHSVNLEGEPNRFPFDNYHLNFVLAIPFKNITIGYVKGSFDPVVNATWIPYIDHWPVDYHDIGVQSNSSISDLGAIKKQYIFPAYSGINDTSSGITTRNYTFINIDIGFQRNSTIVSIIIPLIAIFYLLGAIFILDKLDIRVAITLGIFAFLFAFKPVIDPMKPLTTNNVPTIADFLITIVIFSTIAFTVSSVIKLAISATIKSNDGQRKKHPGIIKWVVEWIDRITFFVTTAIIFVYVPDYPPDITSWLVPAILFGLGYGLLLRKLKPQLVDVKEGVK